MGKYYLVKNKPDDYGNCKTELIEASVERAIEYYYHRRVADNHVEILKKYFELVTDEEERERSDEERYYGTE